MLVLMEDAAEAVASADVKTGGGVQFRHRCGQCAQWPGVGDSLMRPVRVVELLKCVCQNLRDGSELVFRVPGC
jgi:hypothetical protein